jgi:ribosomal protein S18 acetylase RimI-like enzyme
MEAALLQRIQSYLRVAAPRGRDSERVGPFLATFSRDSENPYLNYAIPDDGAEPTAAEVAALAEAYRTRARLPRLEYVAAVAAGFAAEGRLPLMVFRGEHEFSPVDGIELALAQSDEELRGVAAVQWEAYGERGPLPERAVASLRATLANGGLVVLARDSSTGEAAGGGLCTGPHDGATELTSIGVREGFRRRGIAEVMTGRLAQELRARDNDCVFLMAAGAAEERIYARAGFATIGAILHIGHA